MPFTLFSTLSLINLCLFLFYPVFEGCGPLCIAFVKIRIGPEWDRDRRTDCNVETRKKDRLYLHRVFESTFALSEPQRALLVLLNDNDKTIEIREQRFRLSRFRCNPSLESPTSGIMLCNKLFHKLPGELDQRLTEDELQGSLLKVFKLFQIMLKVPAISWQLIVPVHFLKKSSTALSFTNTLTCCNRQENNQRLESGCGKSTKRVSVCSVSFVWTNHLAQCSGFDVVMSPAFCLPGFRCTRSS